MPTIEIGRLLRAQVEQMLDLELRNQGEEPGVKSHKQSAKDLVGRKKVG